MIAPPEVQLKKVMHLLNKSLPPPYWCDYYKRKIVRLQFRENSVAINKLDEMHMMPNNNFLFLLLNKMQQQEIHERKKSYEINGHRKTDLLISFASRRKHKPFEWEVLQNYNKKILSTTNYIILQQLLLNSELSTRLIAASSFNWYKGKWCDLGTSSKLSQFSWTW